MTSIDNIAVVTAAGNTDAPTTRLRRHSLYRDPLEGWRLIRHVRADGIERGEIAIPEFANQVIIVATAFVQHDDAGGATLTRLERGKWFFDSAGLWNEALAMAEIQRVLNAGVSSIGSLFDQSEIDEILKALQDARPASRAVRHSNAARPATAILPFGVAPPRRAPTVAEYIADKIEKCGRTQMQIAKLCGVKPNFVSMLKTGATPVPTTKIRLLAQALRTDPLELCRLVLAEYNPELMGLVDQMVAREVSH